MRNLLTPYRKYMTKKRFKKPDVPVEAELPTPDYVPTTVELLLADHILMQKAVEMAAAGFSMSSIAASVGIPASTFVKWIKKGKANEEDNPNDPEVLLWKELSKGWAIAKGLAESTLSKVDPKFFLTRGPARLLGDDWSEESSSPTKNKETLDVTEDFLTALKRLRERGFDLNEIIDNNLLSLKTESVERKEVDLLQEHGINQVQKALPGPLAQEAHKLDNILNLERNMNGEERTD